MCAMMRQGLGATVVGWQEQTFEALINPKEIRQNVPQDFLMANYSAQGITSLPILKNWDIAYIE